MQVARKAGAAGGTVLRGRVADAQSLNELAQVDIQDERGILCIMAPAAVSQRVMEDVNREFGLRSPAHGIICAVPVEKAYKI